MHRQSREQLRYSDCSPLATLEDQVWLATGVTRHACVHSVVLRGMVDWDMPGPGRLCGIAAGSLDELPIPGHPGASRPVHRHTRLREAPVSRTGRLGPRA